MLTIAAPSRMTTYTTGVGELSCTGTRSSKQPPISEYTSRSPDAATSRALMYYALDMIFGLLCDHVPSILVSQEGQFDSVLSDSNINLKGRRIA